MNLRGWITLALLAFVAASLGRVAFKFARGMPQPTPEGERWEAEPAAAPGQSVLLPDHVTVYYCHGAVRCPQCVGIREAARQSLERDFALQLTEGRITWKVINYDQPEDAHFDADFHLGSAPGVVLMRFHDHRPADWKYLDEVWPRIREGDTEGLKNYISRAIRDFLTSPPAGR